MSLGGNNPGGGNSLFQSFQKSQEQKREVKSFDIREDRIYIHPKLKPEIDNLAIWISESSIWGDLKPNGAYFYGPPGNGKTLTMQYLATKTDAYVMQFPSYDAESIKQTFAAARQRHAEEGKPAPQKRERQSQVARLLW